MRKLIKFIYNPRSGEGEVAKKLDDIIGVYQEAGFTVIPHRLTFPADPESIFRGIDDSYHHILLAGGDGTVNYIVNALKNMGIDIPLAILPAGTANDFAMMLGTRRGDIISKCRAIIEGETACIDIGKANGEYFVNVFSCGLLTEVSQKTPTLMKNTFGKLAYYLSGVGELARYRKMTVRIDSDGGSYNGKCLLFLVFNGKTAGALPIAYLSKEDDGLLDILIVKGDKTIETLQTAFRYLSRIGSQTAYPLGVEHIRCSYLRAECDTAETTDIDGQPGPEFPLEITCEKNALKVIRPKQHIKKKK